MFFGLKKVLDRYQYSIILLKQLVKTDFRLRYQGSVLGYLWSLLRPLAIFCILYVVFVRFLKVGANIPHFGVYLLFGIVLWNFFIEITVGSIGGIVGKGDLIRKINFPKYILIIASSLSALINVSINLFVVFIFLLIDGVHLSWHALLFLPLLAEFFIFSIGVAFFLSAAYVRFRDIGYIWEVFIQGAVYATPIIYPLDVPIALRYQKVLILNPLAQMIQDARHVVVTDYARTNDEILGHWAYRLIPISVVIFIFVSSALYFKRRSKTFAEHV